MQKTEALISLLHWKTEQPKPNKKNLQDLFVDKSWLKDICSTPTAKFECSDAQWVAKMEHFLSDVFSTDVYFVFVLFTSLP